MCAGAGRTDTYHSYSDNSYTNDIVRDNIVEEDSVIFACMFLFGYVIEFCTEAGCWIFCV